jgi:hypothetical protein
MARKGRRSSKDERIDAIRLLEEGYTKAQVARICNVTECVIQNPLGVRLGHSVTSRMISRHAAHGN